MESNNESMGIDVRYCTCYYFGDTINIKYLDLDTILLDKKSYENHVILHTTPYGAKALCIIFDKINGNIKNMIKLNIYHYFVLMENVREFLIELGVFYVKKAISRTIIHLNI